jgi:hypothetical protein
VQENLERILKFDEFCRPFAADQTIVRRNIYSANLFNGFAVAPD